MQLTKTEASLWAKYWGREFIDDEQYWQDVFEVYKDQNILLPVEHTNLNVLKLLKLFECEKCGECCKYKFVPVNAYDIKRLLDSGLGPKTLSDRDGQTYLNSENGCVFLKDGCSIYSQRPEGCFNFPLQGPVVAEAEGRKIKQIRIRLKCRAALKLARKIITQTIDGSKLLLPDLTIIPK